MSNNIVTYSYIDDNKREHILAHEIHGAKIHQSYVYKMRKQKQKQLYNQFGIVADIVISIKGVK